MTDVEKAEKIVADLEMKRGRLLDRGKEIGDQIAAIGFKVHAENDKTAQAGRPAAPFRKGEAVSLLLAQAPRAPQDEEEALRCRFR
jgi:hypothetical protein